MVDIKFRNEILRYIKKGALVLSGLIISSKAIQALTTGQPVAQIQNDINLWRTNTWQIIQNFNKGITIGSGFKISSHSGDSFIYFNNGNYIQLETTGSGAGTGIEFVVGNSSLTGLFVHSDTSVTTRFNTLDDGVAGDASFAADVAVSGELTVTVTDAAAFTVSNAGSVTTYFTVNTSTGAVTSKNNTLDDGSGNITIIGTTYTMGATTNLSTPAETMTFLNSGYAAPSNTNATSNGDKYVYWNSASIKCAYGLDAGTLWIQSTGGVIKFYTGSAPAPVLAMTIGIGASVTYYNGDTATGDGIPCIRGTIVSITGQLAAIGATTIYTTVAAKVYRMNIYMLCTATNISTMTTNVIWTDEFGTHTVAAFPAFGATAGQFGNVAFVFKANASTNIRYSTTSPAAAATYSLYIRLEEL